ncbi:hypothetical protein H5407_01365 [Mitsuaria sp. WAJ17]|uniref:hypothetical protein n=1 Tax=Mitsuaria sp. WAJ17 TaxID=2761452 RepID=UPI001603D797|nr:hypothetical protein [Mitsuaria sp. WAJ17]MBB2483868.1 hypothetical protein [Mitsuaria sp. WAJ17]
MNAWIGSALALAALVMGGVLMGWQGVILALTVVVFWLLLQFSRLMRVMQAANGAPVGRIDSAVMLQSRLHPGMKLMEVLPLTRSLGAKVEGREEAWAWTDAGGVRLELQFSKGVLQQWVLQRPPEQGTPTGDGEAGAT